ncbi:hypothetical protein KCU78_g3716, partial [Aureobasidium melanogenum]
MAPASFSSLPPELVSKICSDPGLEKKDLIALRLTSKAQGIHASATKAFGKYCFTVIPLLYNKYSLETFVKICQHHIFGSCVRNVQLSCARIDPDHFHDLLTDIVYDGGSRKAVMRKAKRLAARCDSAETFAADVARSLLDQAFYQLAMSNHDLKITVSTEESGSLGYRKVFALNPECYSFYADIPSTVGHLLSSAQRAGCKVPVVNIIGTARTFKDSSVLGLADLFHSISELSLELAFIMDHGEPEPRDLIHWMKHILLSCNNLKSLELSLALSESDSFSNLDGFSESISHMSLETLRLSNMSTNQRSMTKLMIALGPTLRCLIVKNCFISGSWKEILVSIQQYAVQLDYFEFEDGVPLPSGTKITYDGASAIRSGFEKMLQALESSDDEIDDQ